MDQQEWDWIQHEQKHPRRTTGWSSSSNPTLGQPVKGCQGCCVCVCVYTCENLLIGLLSRKHLLAGGSHLRVLVCPHWFVCESVPSVFPLVYGRPGRGPPSSGVPTDTPRGLPVTHMRSATQTTTGKTKQHAEKKTDTQNMLKSQFLSTSRLCHIIVFLNTLLMPHTFHAKTVNYSLKKSKYCSNILSTSRRG